MSSGPEAVSQQRSNCHTRDPWSSCPGSWAGQRRQTDRWRGVLGPWAAWRAHYVHGGGGLGCPLSDALLHRVHGDVVVVAPHGQVRLRARGPVSGGAAARSSHPCWAGGQRLPTELALRSTPELDATHGSLVFSLRDRVPGSRMPCGGPAAEGRLAKSTFKMHQPTAT